MFQRWIKLGNHSCLLLGPRRAGKTTLLKSRFPDYQYVTLDDFDYLQLAEQDPKGLIAELGDKAIIDEVQRVPKLTIAIKHRLDQGNAHYLMTGSSGIGLLDASADTLAGRIDVLHLPTGCWGEPDGLPAHRLFTMQPSALELKQAARKLEDAVNFGGFPEVVSAVGAEAKQTILKRYRDTYFTRELAQLSNIENVEGLYAVLQHISRSIGSHLEISNFARESGLSHPTAKKYLNALQQSDMTFRLYGYQYGPAKRYVKAAKTYYADNGIVTALGHQASEGQRMENFVVSELEKRRKLGFIQTDQLFYYKSTGGAEIDVVFEVGSEIVAIEVKTSPRVTQRDLRNLVAFREATEKKVRCYLFYAGTRSDEQNDVHIVPIASLYRGM